jgi:hypothetical protein
MLGIEDMVTAGSKSPEQTAKLIRPLVDSLSRLTGEAIKLIETLKPKGKSDRAASISIEMGLYHQLRAQT